VESIFGTVEVTRTGYGAEGTPSCIRSMVRSIFRKDSLEVRRGEGRPETFTFLGFTHFCGQLTTGTFTVWRITAQKQMPV